MLATSAAPESLSCCSAPGARAVTSPSGLGSSSGSFPMAAGLAGPPGLLVPRRKAQSGLAPAATAAWAPATRPSPCPRGYPAAASPQCLCVPCPCFHPWPVHQMPMTPQSAKAISLKPKAHTATSRKDSPSAPCSYSHHVRGSLHQGMWQPSWRPGAPADPAPLDPSYWDTLPSPHAVPMLSLSCQSPLSQYRCPPGC